MDISFSVELMGPLPEPKKSESYWNRVRMHTSESGSAALFPVIRFSPASKVKRTQGSPAYSTISATSALSGQTPVISPLSSNDGTTYAVVSTSRIVATRARNTLQLIYWFGAVLMAR